MAAAGLLLGLGCLWIRVAWLQIGRHAFYAERAERNQEQRVLIRATRGELRDRHGRPLARDLPTYSISAAPREMPDAPAVAPELAFIKAGSLDDASWVEPAVEAWTSSAQPWSPRFEGAAQMDRGPS